MLEVLNWSEKKNRLFVILVMYLLVVKNDVRKPDFLGADINCFYSAIFRRIPLQEMIVPVLIKEETLQENKNVRLARPEIGPFCCRA